MGQRAGVQWPCGSPNLKAQITALREGPGRRDGGHSCLPGQGRVRPAFHELEGNQGPGLPCPGARHSGQLDFLGFSANLVIVVNADGNEKEAAGQEQQNPQGHQARLGQRGSDHCGGKARKGQGSAQGGALTPPQDGLRSCQLSDPTDASVLTSPHGLSGWVMLVSAITPVLGCGRPRKCPCVCSEDAGVRCVSTGV